MEDPLYSNGEYYIKSIKEDHAPHRYEWVYTIFVLVTAIALWVYVWITSQSYYEATHDQSGSLIKLTLGFTMVVMCIVVAIALMQSYRSCGTRIMLCHTQGIIDQRDYQFTKDPMFDAEKINKTVEHYKRIINERVDKERKAKDDKDRLEREKTIAYKDVMGRVKKNE